MLTGDGEIFEDISLDKITDKITVDLKNASGLELDKIRSDALKVAGELVKENKDIVVNKTATATKQLIQKIQSIEDTINDAKCIIPKDADDILRAKLLQQCLSPNLGKRVKHNIIS